MAHTELDRLEKELLDYFYFGDAIVIEKQKQKQKMKDYHNSPAKCYICKMQLKRSNLYYHLKKVHNTTAKNYLKNK